MFFTDISGKTCYNPVKLSENEKYLIVCLKVFNGETYYKEKEFRFLKLLFGKVDQKDFTSEKFLINHLESLSIFKKLEEVGLIDHNGYLKNPVEKKMIDELFESSTSDHIFSFLQNLSHKMIFPPGKEILKVIQNIIVILNVRGRISNYKFSSLFNFFDLN